MVGGNFAARARREALRYGPDPWIFVRELLQNARDAGAHVATLDADEHEGAARIVFGDDGHGMTFEHARRYLFTLYASSKEDDAGAAGRFGVGFWSVLRFEPTRLRIRSWPQRGRPWEIELDGALTEAASRTPPPRRAHGTEIVLERPAIPGDALARRVHDAAWQTARFLARRDDPSRALDIRVNGVAVSAPFELPAPSAHFRQGRCRGVVALGAEARVELFSQGLRVRSASALEDLLSADGSSDLTRVRFPSLADGVAPQAILDGADFEPLLARGDVRVTPSLRRLVGLGQREMRRLIESQIDALRPRAWHQRLRWPLAAAAALAMAAGAGAWLGRRGGPDVVWGPPPTTEPAALAASAPAPLPSAASDAAPAASSPLAYRDLRGLYSGPRSDRAPAGASALALTYEPPEASLRFAALVLDRPFEPPPVPVDAGPYVAAATSEGPAIDVRLAVIDAAGWLRLPVPTGRRLDSGTVRLDGRAMTPRLSASGEPLVFLSTPVAGVVTYRTWPGRGADAPVVAPAVPAALAAQGAALRALSALGDTAVAVDTATRWVRERVAYSTSAEVASRHAAAARAGEDLLSATLRIGAGDCDIQNAVLVTLLQAAGIRARLAVGYVAEGGMVLAPPHAWVEWRDAHVAWQVADASFDTESPPRSAPSPSVLPRGAETQVAAVPIAPRFSRIHASAAVVCGAAAIGALVMFVRARPRRQVRLAPEQDVAALVRGALQRPEAFREVPVVYRRPLLPQLKGPLVSLADAWHHAAERRLFRSARRTELARRCARGGALVLDAARGEARAAADALGAVDLDEWDAFLRTARRTPLLAAAAARLAALGHPCDLRAAPGLGSPAVLDVPSRDAGRVVVLDAQEPWLLAAEGAFTRRPAAALLAVADALAEAVRWDAADRRAFLRPLAREALREAAP